MLGGEAMAERDGDITLANAFIECKDEARSPEVQREATFRVTPPLPCSIQPIRCLPHDTLKEGRLTEQNKLDLNGLDGSFLSHYVGILIE